MSSNSIRVTASLFQAAQTQGELKKTRKSEQTPTSASTKPVVMSEAEMWAFKRAQQARDVKDVESGKVSGRSMGWFSKRLMKQVTLIDAPY